jgi:phenylalanyl-tRNA synthetase beta chain
MIMALTGVEPDFVPAENSSPPAISELQVTIEGSPIGVLRHVPESVRQSLALPSSVVVAEIDLGMLSRQSREIRYQDYSRFPAADVDITIPCGIALSWRDVERAIRKARLAELEEAILLGLYVDPLRPEIRNITIRLTFRASDRTLSQDEVNRERDRFFEVLKQEFGVIK